MPPKTLGEVRPASLATSTKVTGDAACVAGCAGLKSAATFFCGVAADGHGCPVPLHSSTAERFHFQRGVASASRRVLPRTTAELPRNLRRGNFIGLLSLA